MTDSGRRARRRPPWWPENEQWPPQAGHWAHRRRRGFARPFGCALVALIVLAAGTLVLATWAVFAITGLVTAPHPVLIAGLIVLAVIAITAGRAARGVRRMSAPVDDLADAAERIERGDYSARVTENGPPRVRALVRAFNEMSARLAAADEGRRAFLADAAHELRTPLSIIEAQLEAIEDGLYPVDAEHMAPIHEQMRTLEKLIDDMRTIALVDAGGLQLNRLPTDIGAIVEHTVVAFQPGATAREITLSSEIRDPLPSVLADEQRIRQVLTNLLSNALTHTRRGGHVTVAVRVADRRDDVEVTVTDDGSGISAELLPHVFDRFAKEDGSSGSGLGLAICRDLVEAHGGTIGITSEPGRGTTVSFTLPVAPGGSPSDRV